MFEKFIEWLKRIMRRVDSGNGELQPVVSDKMAIALALWSEIYTEDIARKNSGRESLKLASSIAEEFARLVTLEFKSEITGSARAEYLNEQYQRFLSNIKINTEYACAKGAVVFKPYITDENITVDVVQADRFCPIMFNSSGELTGAAFMEQFIRGKYIYTRLEVHELTPAGYKISNAAYKSTNADILGSPIDLTDVDVWADILPETVLPGQKKPLFVYFKMPMANTIDEQSPLGVSVYSRAVDQIRQADEQYDRLLWEYDGGELAVDADITLFGPKDETGHQDMPKGKERLFRKLYMSMGDSKKQLEHYAPTLRDSSYMAGLNDIKREIEFKVGLAFGTLSKIEYTAKTATEIIASRQRSYSKVSNIQASLQAALEQLILAMDVWTSYAKLAPAGKYDVSFEWDDSLIVDSGEEQKVWMQEVSSGLMTPIEYRMRRYGETEEQAKKMLPQMTTLFPKGE